MRQFAPLLIAVLPLSGCSTNVAEQSDGALAKEIVEEVIACLRGQSCDRNTDYLKRFDSLSCVLATLDAGLQPSVHRYGYGNYIANEDRGRVDLDFLSAARAGCPGVFISYYPPNIGRRRKFDIGNILD